MLLCCCLFILCWPLLTGSTVIRNKQKQLFSNWNSIMNSATIQGTFLKNSLHISTAEHIYFNTTKKQTRFFQSENSMRIYQLLLSEFLLRFNVWVAKKDTKRSSNTLLRLVSFFATQTLQAWHNNPSCLIIKLILFVSLISGLLKFQGLTHEIQ